MIPSLSLVLPTSFKVIIFDVYNRFSTVSSRRPIAQFVGLARKSVMGIFRFYQTKQLEAESAKGEIQDKVRAEAGDVGESAGRRISGVRNVRVNNCKCKSGMRVRTPARKIYWPGKPG